MTHAARLAAAAVLGAVLGTALCSAFARAAPAAVAELASACASCHAADGAQSGIPLIAGLDEDRIERSMRAYRSGERRSQVMRVIAGALTPDETAEIARYLAGRRQAAQ